VLYGGRDYVNTANDEIVCIIQIETVRAVEGLGDILSVPGIDAVMIGPSDLAMDMGIPPVFDNPHPDHVTLCNRVLETCQKHQVVPGIFTSGPEEGARRAAEGWRFLPIGSDAQYVMEGGIHALRTVQGECKEEKQKRMDPS
jgi:4-hydroxy-2-oxoheptanedioate aldolase